MQTVAWLASVALCLASLILSARYRAGTVIKLAIGSIVGGMLSVTAIGLVLRELSVRPSDQLATILFQLLFTLLVIAMLNIANVAFHGIVGAQTAFHKRYNAANLRRFPVRFVIARGADIKRFGTWFWGMGSALMLYGVWFDMKI